MSSNKLIKIINNIFPLIPIISDLYSFWNQKIKEIFCKHKMKYWDMKWYMDDENSPNYSDWNGKIWKDVFCECQKCGVKYKKSMKVGEWGSWKKSDFIPTNNTFIQVEIYQWGKETKRQKRDRLIDSLLK